MTKDIFVCGLDTPIDELMAQMTERRIRHIPVVENGALVGLVSIGDVVKRKIQSAEQEAAALRDYIAS
jgi:CBS domain-containing protein